MKKLIMLETINSTVKIQKDKDLDTLSYFEEDEWIIDGEDFIGINLYLIDTDAEIEEDDYYIGSENKIIYTSKEIYYDLFSILKDANNSICWKSKGKILASTDKSLNLPIISEYSIKLAIDYFNRIGKKEIEVEIEEKIENEVLWSANGLSHGANNYGKPRIPKLNQEGKVDITIPEEKMYSREKVINLCTNAYQRGLEDKEDYFSHDISNWLKENLK